MRSFLIIIIKFKIIIIVTNVIIVVLSAERTAPLYFEVKFYPREPTVDLHFEQTRLLGFYSLDVLHFSFK